MTFKAHSPLAAEPWVPPAATGPGDALIVVDVQNDFCPGGALAVADGAAVVPVLNLWSRWFAAAGLPVVYTQDWHPADHISFAHRGGPWPPHCVQLTPGADFHPDLVVQGVVFRKGFDPDREAYSGFHGHLSSDRPLAASAGLAEWLKAQGVGRVFVGGLATDYCVRATVLDARGEGLAAFVIADGSRAVEVAAGDGAKALADMQAAGARVLPVPSP